MNDFEAVYRAIVADPRYLSRLDWGMPRPGHPEGTIRAHIKELEVNLERLRPRLSTPDYWRLKVIVHVHDTFKPDASPGASTGDPRGHSSLARAFLERFCDDEDMLAVVQWHDEPYALWRQVESKGAASPERLEKLWKAIQDWDLYLAFLLIDGCTSGKTRAPVRWFFRLAQERVETRFTEVDIFEIDPGRFDV